MAPVAIDLIERRRERRRPGGGTRWRPQAVLRPGQPVTLLNISSRAALVESEAQGARQRRQHGYGRLRAAALLEPQPDAGIILFWLALLTCFDVVFVTLALWTFEPLMTD